MYRNILIIGGTYFLGKAFTELMLSGTDSKITLLHRGSGEPNQLLAQLRTQYSGRIFEYLADRHNENALKNFSIQEEKESSVGTGRAHFDAIVDFCAYAPGDITTLLENLNADTDQYIFISTTDVYRRGTGELQNEDSPLEDRDFGGDAGAYISGKVALEKEIKDACKNKGCAYTVLRPAFIFGPDNYAPREGIYFHWIDSANQIIHPADADGEFQLVYVKDVAGAILLAITKEEARNNSFNVCENKMYTYDSFADLLKRATGKDFSKAEVSVADINEKGIPLPFPLTKAETNRYDGSKLAAFGMLYTDNETAMRETYLYGKNDI